MAATPQYSFTDGVQYAVYMYETTSLSFYSQSKF
jgi:hypothetical protein